MMMNDMGYQKIQIMRSIFQRGLDPLSGELIQLKTPEFEIPFPKLPALKPAMDFGEKMLSALELEAK